MNITKLHLDHLLLYLNMTCPSIELAAAVSRLPFLVIRIKKYSEEGGEGVGKRREEERDRSGRGDERGGRNILFSACIPSTNFLYSAFSISMA